MTGVISRTKDGVEGAATRGVLRPDDEPTELGPQLEWLEMVECVSIVL